MDHYLLLLVRAQIQLRIQVMERLGQIFQQAQVYSVLVDMELIGMEQCGLRPVKEQIQLLIHIMVLIGLDWEQLHFQVWEI
ncbi:MAG: hypothetical protein EBR59_08915 [Methylococcaceae bacterium]|nr:hypothetical protein [Methylococcaceae bacterium]